jgi:hypothetical protein
MALAITTERAGETTSVIYHARATGAAAIAESWTAQTPAVLKQVACKLSAIGTGNLTITLNSNAGVAFDTLLLTQDMSAVTDSFLWQPDIPIELETGDSIDIAWANEGTVTYGLTIVAEDA